LENSWNINETTKETLFKGTRKNLKMHYYSLPNTKRWIWSFCKQIKSTWPRDG